MIRHWLDIFGFEEGLYLWGSYFVALGLFAIEIATLAFRESAILGHLGWEEFGLHAKPADPDGTQGAADPDRP
jgi:hypothetical protein